MTSSLQALENALVYLIGYSGTGKYTIAKAIEKKIGAVIVDNQLINNPIFTVVQADGVSSLPFGVWQEAIHVRNAVYSAMRFLAKPETSFVLTNELFENWPGDSEVFCTVASIAEHRKSVFLPVVLKCDREEHLRRVVSPDRRTRLKLVNADNLAEKLETHSLLMPAHENLLQLDVTHLTPLDAAEVIVGKLLLLQDKSSPKSSGDIQENHEIVLQPKPEWWHKTYGEMANMPVQEVIPGFRARMMHTPHHTVAFWDVDSGAVLPQHSHPHEQISMVTRGEFSLTVDGETRILKPGMMACIAPDKIHSGRAITACEITDIFYPARRDYMGGIK